MFLKYELPPNSLKYQSTDCPYVIIDKNNYRKNSKTIKMTINIFHDEIEWFDMYNYDDAIERLKTGSKLYVLLNNDNIYGYFWCKRGEDESMIYNVFMRNKGIQRKWRGREFLYNVINDNHQTEKLVCFIDSWNEPSIKMFEKLGFINKK